MSAPRTDSTVWASIDAEARRQEAQLELIASENHASLEVIAAMGTVLTNKYAEGYPGRRYYGGCEYVDEVETIARDRVKELFGSERANVQPHSGTQATIGALMAMAEPGDDILAMSLDHGGHLSHGHPKNASGVFYKFHHYGVRRDDERLDIDQVRTMAQDLRPKVIVAGGSAYPRTIDFAPLAEIAREVGAKLLVDMAHIAGLVATGAHPSPVPHADVVSSSTHKTLRGPRGGLILSTKDFGKQVNSAVFPGGQGGPLMHVIAAKAIAFREAASAEFKTYIDQVLSNARILAETLGERGLRIVSGGTDNHLLLVDVSSVGLTGDVAEDALHAVDLTCNKNLIPFDAQPPMKTSGVRLGTAAITTRGLGGEDVRRMAHWIADVLDAPEDAGIRARVKAEVAELAVARPIYPTAAV
ncbi:serine hydroxymethyltransferase [Engelhardtia mirabilis]|uniref:Serine hydroxymethyltransferase n=1 Tax=Engelhardtia mirabilis TaxID=2528011 RepID=A0A518BKG3_9BACT|nr:Serine hydroxymethyltransferase [Planctomycetes bacterium Pla133]QDV01781.1 Serine hydroxymethyltransferase [Planctomycetes bacterium Pla86]